VHAEFREIAARLHQHVEQVRDRCTLVAADIGDAGLQQRLGDRENALAVERVPGAQAQVANLLVERNFQTAPGAASTRVRDAI